MHRKCIHHNRIDNPLCDILCEDIYCKGVDGTHFVRRLAKYEGCREVTFRNRSCARYCTTADDIAFRLSCASRFGRPRIDPGWFVVSGYGLLIWSATVIWQCMLAFILSFVPWRNQQQWANVFVLWYDTIWLLLLYRYLDGGNVTGQEVSHSFHFHGQSKVRTLRYQNIDARA